MQAENLNSQQLWPTWHPWLIHGLLTLWYTTSSRSSLPVSFVVGPLVITKENSLAMQYAATSMEVYISKAQRSRSAINIFKFCTPRLNKYTKEKCSYLFHAPFQSSFCYQYPISKTQSWIEFCNSRISSKFFWSFIHYFWTWICNQKVF